MKSRMEPSNTNKFKRAAAGRDQHTPRKVNYPNLESDTAMDDFDGGLHSLG